MFWIKKPIWSPGDLQGSGFCPRHEIPATHIPRHRQQPLKPQDNSPLNPVIPWLIILFCSLSALAFVYFYIVPNCASLPVWGRETGSCGTKIRVAYGCGAMFLAAVVYSGYRVAGILAQ